MNFRDLEYVIEASKTLSFSKAALNCNVSQPSLSAQIAKLEQALKANIFIRSHRKISLSAFGAEFVRKAQDILALRDDMLRLAQARQNPLEGSLILGGILTVAPYIFPEIVRQLQHKAPKIKLTLKEGKTDELLEGVLAGRIDAAIISLPTDTHAFESRTLFTEGFYVAVSVDHPLARKKKISEKDLRGKNLILLEEGHCFRHQALDVCRAASAAENEMFQATSLETIRHFVAVGEGITLMPAMAMKKNDGIKYIALDNKNMTRDIGIIWRKTSNKRPQIEKLIELLDI